MKRLVMSALFALCMCTSASASFTPEIFTDNDLDLNGSKGPLSWNVCEENGLWKYSYCFDGDADLKYLIIEVVNDCDFTILGPCGDLDPQFFPKSGIFGLKFEGGNCVEFYTELAPTTGSFFAKDICGNIYRGDCIVIPGAPCYPPTSVPEPGTVALLGLGLGCGALVRRRK